jgi:hypothetical protein
MNGQNTSVEVVRLPTVLSIRDIKIAHAQIRGTLDAHDRVVLDVPPGASMDLSFLQLIESARLQAEITGKSLELAAPADEGVRAVLERAGFLPMKRPEDARFWFHEEMSR